MNADQMNLFMRYFLFLLSSPFLPVDQPPLSPQFHRDPFLYSLPPSPFSPSHSIILSLSISKGQMFPAVTVALHWYSALNLAKSQAAVSARSNHTAIWHRAHRQAGGKGLKN